MASNTNGERATLMKGSEADTPGRLDFQPQNVLQGSSKLIDSQKNRGSVSGPLDDARDRRGTLGLSNNKSTFFQTGPSSINSLALPLVNDKRKRMSTIKELRPRAYEALGE